ncbi:MAG: HAD-IA family hydrolase [Lachnospiraceae bacterium]|nr:HAD-IA family hydrolase [Lachnospiraceae bacterium]
MGYRAVLFDLDNTLVEHDAPADERAKELLHRLLEIGFSIGFISNNDEERVKSFREAVIEGHPEYEDRVIYTFKAGKPLPRGYRQAMEKLGTDEMSTMFVGDQLFTDIWGANNARVRSVLVQPIAKHEEIQIVLKRIPEKLIKKLYLKKHKLRG